ncbi:MAG TPA: glycosyltransferase family 1 protein [Burkholderiales bacterium]|nr:glycosyltransferase family 1 protein [Burkholderiales bacterium]
MTNRNALLNSAGEPQSLEIARAPSRSERLRIAVVTETYPPELNGVSLTVRRAVDFLSGRGHDVELVRPRQRERDGQHAGVPEVLVRGVPLPFYPGMQFGLPAARQLQRRWHRCPPDVIHIAPEGPLGWSALQAALACAIPVTSDYRTQFHRYSTHYGVGWLQEVIDRYLRAFHNRAHATFVATEALREELAKRGYRNCRTVGRGIDTALFNPGRRNIALRNQWGLDDSGLAFVHVGRLAPEKNLELAVRAFDDVRAVHQASRMIWVGDGPLRARMQRAHRDHVFCGVATGEALAALYASADVFLFPSLTETFGNVTLEALASGLALIAFRYGAAGEHCRHGVHACLPRFNDEEAFVRTAVQLARAPAMLARIRNAAPRAVARLAWPTVLREFEQELVSVARNGTASLQRHYAAG